MSSQATGKHRRPSTRHDGESRIVGSVKRQAGAVAPRAENLRQDTDFDQYQPAEQV
jgi:hypothetical protein